MLFRDRLSVGSDDIEGPFSGEIPQHCPTRTRDGNAGDGFDCFRRIREY